MEVEAPTAPLHTQQHAHPSASSLFLGGLPRTLIYRIGWEDPPAQVLRWHNGWGAPGSCLALGGKRACCLPNAARDQDITSRGACHPGRVPLRAQRTSPACPGHLHMASLVGHHERGGEAVLVVQGAAADGVAHPSDRSIAWERQRGLRALPTSGAQAPTSPDITRQTSTADCSRGWHSPRPPLPSPGERASALPISSHPEAFSVSRVQVLSAKTFCHLGSLLPIVLSFRPPPTFLPHLAEWPFGPEAARCFLSCKHSGPGAWHHTRSPLPRDLPCLPRGPLWGL